MAATDLLHGLGVNPRSQARAFVHNSLVDGWVADTKIAPGVACAIAWLLSLMDGMPGDLKDYHAIGYDITYVPGPAGQHSMFNFRAVFSPKMDPAVMVDTARAVPTPEWQPPPH
jgi:hypothetical protein